MDQNDSLNAIFDLIKKRLAESHLKLRYLRFPSNFIKISIRGILP